MNVLRPWVLMGVLAVLSGRALAAEATLFPDNRPGLPTHEVHMARLVYEHAPRSGWGPGRAWWRIDWPEAEHHFLAGVARYTAMDVAPDSVHVSLLDDAVFEHPWLFAQQPGRWRLSDTETARLGEYLRRGGFLVVDDFHGPDDWQVFRDAMQEALPGLAIVDLESDVLLNIHYSLSQRTQIPGRRHLYSTADGIQVQMPFGPPRWRGIHDEDGRLMVAINFNMDTGDAWEHADDAAYPVAMTSYAYRVGINYLIYALTH
ncbi:DUF4159 domain-containing protein [Granulosicoccus sp. 3-233]|uniref:DUF4159 domain-containing protein n=1 Tax=Granulosicoccus sp. 3-233 TaxID=3417969 RepID=UPI003D32BB2B